MRYNDIDYLIQFYAMNALKKGISERMMSVCYDQFINRIKEVRVMLICHDLPINKSMNIIFIISVGV